MFFVPQVRCGILKVLEKSRRGVKIVKAADLGDIAAENVRDNVSVALVAGHVHRKRLCAQIHLEGGSQTVIIVFHQISPYLKRTLPLRFKRQGKEME